ncbi:hypothetical protein [Frankia tisae]|uniref:hypothetical protein n=1 Tax=Frankia tisae TaxID=2950104 RepID=UPI0021C02F76|nr:hypothetical protein [Frankia tisae]
MRTARCGLAEARPRVVGPFGPGLVVALGRLVVAFDGLAAGGVVVGGVVVGGRRACLL